METTYPKPRLTPHTGAGDVLFVSRRGRNHSLVKTLASLAVRFDSVSSCREARKRLIAAPVDLVITELTLPDGNWCDLLRFSVEQSLRTTTVVTSAHCDEQLWSEVLWRGAYDLLVEPYQQDELRRTVEGALRRSRTSQSARNSAERQPIGHETERPGTLGCSYPDRNI